MPGMSRDTAPASIDLDRAGSASGRRNPHRHLRHPRAPNTPLRAGGHEPVRPPAQRYA